MRRFSILVPTLAVLFLSLVTTQHVGVQAVAQADASATSGHPLVGAWLFDLGEEGGPPADVLRGWHCSLRRRGRYDGAGNMGGDG